MHRVLWRFERSSWSSRKMPVSWLVKFCCCFIPTFLILTILRFFLYFVLWALFLQGSVLSHKPQCSAQPFPLSSMHLYVVVSLSSPLSYLKVFWRINSYICKGHLHPSVYTCHKPRSYSGYLCHPYLDLTIPPLPHNPLCPRVISVLFSECLWDLFISLPFYCHPYLSSYHYLPLLPFTK